MSTEPQPRIPSAIGDPPWEAAALLPLQGEWSEEDFLKFHTNRMAELVDGRLEVLPMPNLLHQLIVIFFLDNIREFLSTTARGGVTLMAPLPVRLFPGTILEPDILYVAEENLPTGTEEYPTKIDFAIEIVSKGQEAWRRDYQQKRVDYAKAGVSEYWIVDPQENLITVLGLNQGEYETLGEIQITDGCRTDHTATRFTASELRPVGSTVSFCALMRQLPYSKVGTTSATITDFFGFSPAVSKPSRRDFETPEYCWELAC